MNSPLIIAFYSISLNYTEKHTVGSLQYVIWVNIFFNKLMRGRSQKTEKVLVGTRLLAVVSAPSL